MLRKVIAASFVLVLSVGVVFAEEIQVAITKVQGSKVSFFKMEGKGKDAKKVGDEITLPVAKDLKVLEIKKKGEPGEALEGGLKHEMFSNIDSEKGRRATIVTEDNKITEIRVRAKKKQ